ncbi:MAG: MBL fold metallo-hydrolase [Gammaproteobacteria bacterium]|nr:MBL fold metallo-hydrolase [Gammaproteobacteria bacterium]
MNDYRALRDGIYCVDSGYEQREYAAIYLLREGDEVAIIETATQHSIPRLLKVLSDLKISHQQIKYVIATHIHLDHAGGVSAMMAMFDQARLIAHPRGVKHMLDPEKLIKGSIEVYGEQTFRRLYGDIKPVDESRVDVAEDGDKFMLAGRELVFLDTPGHARHHFCIYDAKSRGIFSGDTFGISYPLLHNLKHGLIPSSSPTHFDPVAMNSSLDKLLAYQPEYIYLTHYGEIDQPAAKANELRQWLADLQDLCLKINPVDAASKLELKNALRHMTVDKLAGQVSCSEAELLALLGTDIKLNAAGLAIWWESTGYA